jgi:hypothetical protein
MIQCDKASQASTSSDCGAAGPDRLLSLVSDAPVEPVVVDEVDNL